MFRSLSSRWPFKSSFSTMSDTSKHGGDALEDGTPAAHELMDLRIR